MKVFNLDFLTISVKNDGLWVPREYYRGEDVKVYFPLVDYSDCYIRFKKRYYGSSDLDISDEIVAFHYDIKNRVEIEEMGGVIDDTVGFKLNRDCITSIWMVNSTTKKFVKADKVVGWISIIGLPSRRSDWSEVNTDGVVELSDGSFLIKDYNKYGSGLCILHSRPAFGYEYVSCGKDDLNLSRGYFDILYGAYFVSKKGTKCFRVDKNGPHKLIRDDWGGAFNSYRGGSLPVEGKDVLYYKRAKSNGGGMGYDYVVVPRDWKNVLSVEDI
jgi:hypothetical protein